MVIRSFSDIFSKALDIDNLGKILIISPHPDDEVFGCGYLMSKLSNKNNIEILILSKGEAYANEYGVKQASLIAKRKELTYSANQFLGIKPQNISFLDFPDGDFENVGESEIQRLKNAILKYKPDTVFYPHPFENSPDHEYASKIIDEITKKTAINKFYYCVWVWHHMRLSKVFKMRFSNSFVLNGNKKIKKTAIDIYAKAKDKNGNYYSGKLPHNLINGITWRNELYFKAD